MRSFPRPLLLAALLSFATLHLGSAAEIRAVAGTGAPGASGDGGPATAAALSDPSGLVRGPDRALYICDTANHSIRRIGPDGVIVTVAGNGTRGYSGDGGPAIKAQLNEPYEVRFDRSGNLFFVERLNHVVRRVDAKSGIISTVAGNGKAGFSGDDGPAAAAQLNDPHSIGFDRAGDLYICDVLNHRIRKVDGRTGTISTVAGTGEKKPTPDGAPIATAPLHGPRALDFDREGNLWLALREGNAVYRLDFTAGKIFHVAGTGKKGDPGNGGPAKAAALAGPKGISVGPDGRVFLADTESHTIRVIDPQRGTIDAFAGTGEKGDGPDGDPLACKLNRPHGVFADTDGAVFIGDSGANRVRVVRK